jgi:hypothetical protein
VRAFRAAISHGEQKTKSASCCHATDRAMFGGVRGAWSQAEVGGLLGMSHVDRISWILGEHKDEQFIPELSWLFGVLAGLMAADRT